MPRERGTGPLNMNEAVCDTCGLVYTIGEWWLCPHGTGLGGYDPFTPTTDDMIASEPITFGNRGERSRYMDRNAIVRKDVSDRRPGKAVYWDMRSK